MKMFILYSESNILKYETSLECYVQRFLFCVNSQSRNLLNDSRSEKLVLLKGNYNFQPYFCIFFFALFTKYFLIALYLYVLNEAEL